MEQGSFLVDDFFDSVKLKLWTDHDRPVNHKRLPVAKVVTSVYVNTSISMTYQGLEGLYHFIEDFNLYPL